MKTVNANPTKEFFVDMLIRDIRLKEAVIELIDNSIDGARSIRENNNFEGLYIDIEFNENYFQIKDNCGGIPLEIAEHYAFRFGRPNEAQNKNAETTGIFGIGMKRALFKMGEKFSVESTTKNTSFCIELNIKEWLKEDEWDFPFKNYEENISAEEANIGTVIRVDNLYKEIASEFSSDKFVNELIYHIERRVGLDIENGLKIIVNGNELRGNQVHMINSDKIKPVKEEFDYNNVNVQIIAGIAPKTGTNYEPKEAGWYIYCNGRLVVAADKTSLTTWKDIENENNGVNFHNNYAPFRGVVFFTSKNPEELPWNTTKTGIDATSFVYVRARERMLEVFQIVKSFIDEMRKESEGEEITENFENKISQMNSVEITKKTAESVIQLNKQLNISLVKEKTDNPYVRIQYYKPKKEVELVKKYLGVQTNKEVGEKTFEYYMDAECE